MKNDGIVVELKRAVMDNQYVESGYGCGSRAPSITVIIPVLNEEKILQTATPYLNP